MALPLPKVVPDVLPGGRFVTSRSGLNALQEQELKNRMSELQNQFYAPKTQADIDYTQASTNRSNQLLPLDVQNQKNVNQWYAPNIQSEIGLRNATAANTRAEMPYLSTKYANQTRNSLTNAGALQNQVSNSFREWSKTPEGQQIIKNRPDIANAILTQMETQSSQITGAPVNNQMQAPPMNQQQIPSANQQQMPYNNQSQPLNENKSRSDLIKDIQKGAADAYEKTNLPADTKKRLYAGDRFKTAIPSVLNNFQQASYYFSPSGQAQLKADELQAATDKRVPPKLQAYRQFKQGLEFMKVSGAFLEGVPADQVSRQAYGKIYDISNFFNNPTDAMESLKYAINLAQMADDSNRKSLSELKEGKKNESQPDQENMVKVMTPSGKQISLPREGAQRLIKDHPDHKIIG